MNAQIESIKYLHVPFSEKEQVKKLGGRWDKTKRRWFCLKNEREIFSKWHKQRERIYIKSDYEQRLEVKAHGCEWDKTKKKWYCFETNKEALERFERYD